MQKRHASVLIPYRKKSNSEYEFYLQMRDGNACESPNLFSFFGGGIEEWESYDVCIVREIKEELCIDITDHKFFQKFQFDVGDRYVFYLEVGNNFEDEVTVMEGQYGEFLTTTQIMEEMPVSERTKIIMRDFESLVKNSAGLGVNLERPARSRVT